MDVYLNKAWRFIIPSTLTPRYAPRDYEGDKPEITNIKPSEETYNWFIEGYIHSKSKIEIVESPSHDISYNFATRHLKKAKFQLLKTNENPNKDFVLYFRNHDIHKPKILIE